MSIYEYDEEKHIRQVKEEGLEEGLALGIKAMVIDYSEEGFSKDRIIEKLKLRFALSPEDAAKYFEMFHSEE